jgi:hypothetical protein
MSHRKFRLPLAGLHIFVAIGGIAAGIVLTVAPKATPQYLRLAVPRPIILSGPALILLGTSALLVGWTTLRADRSAKASLATAGALLTWVVVQGLLVGLRSWLQILVFLIAIAAILLTAALFSAESGGAPRSARLGPATD